MKGRTTTPARCQLSRLLLACFLILLAPSAGRAAGQPNVLFIAIDDLNDWVGFLDGHPQIQTPNMDRLAQRSVVFSNAHCAAPLCCPSRAAVFSGRQPYNTGVYDNSHSVRKQHPECILLPQWLEKNGYRTLGTGKLLHQSLRGLCQEVYGVEQRWSPFRN